MIVKSDITYTTTLLLCMSMLAIKTAVLGVSHSTMVNTHKS